MAGLLKIVVLSESDPCANQTRKQAKSWLILLLNYTQLFYKRKNGKTQIEGKKLKY